MKRYTQIAVASFGKATCSSSPVGFLRITTTVLRWIKQTVGYAFQGRFIFGSDRSPKRGDLGSLSICVCTLCNKALKKLSKESRGVLGQERTQERAQAIDQERAQERAQAKDQERVQVRELK